MKYILFICLSLCLSSVSAQQNRGTAIPVIEANRDLPKNDLSLSDFCSDISYTKLEFDNKYPVARISGLYVTDKYIFFNSRSSILRYTRDGKKVQMIGSLGQGPGEYLDGSSLVFDEKNNKIYIRANYTNNILIYDPDQNKYLSSFKIQETEGQFLMASEGVLLQAGSTRHRYSSKYYSWRLHDTKGKVVSEKRNPSFIVQKSDHRWKNEIAPTAYQWKDSNHSFCSIHERGSDTIFTISNKFQVIPRFVIKTSSYTQGENDITILSESPRYIFWRLDREAQKIAYSGVYDKKQKKSFIYAQNMYSDFSDEKKKKALGIKNDLDGGLPVRAIATRSSSSHWHFFVEPYDLIEYVNSSAFKNAVVKNPRKKEELQRFVNTLEEDDNPVLVTLTLK